MPPFCLANRNTFSDLIAAGDKRAGHWQVRLVEDYIEANWNQAITIEVLAAVSGASARSIFHSFRHSRGYSPKVFLKSVRLRHAERMLAQADPNSSVTAVALACGFLNLGHFARDYRATFGVLPSETLDERDELDVVVVVRPIQKNKLKLRDSSFGVRSSILERLGDDVTFHPIPEWSFQSS